MDFNYYTDVQKLKGKSELKVEKPMLQGRKIVWEKRSGIARQMVVTFVKATLALGTDGQKGYGYLNSPT